MKSVCQGQRAGRCSVQRRALHVSRPGIGAVVTATAVRFDSREIAGLGIVGALVAPMLVEGAGSATASVAFLGVALASSVGVLVWRRWNWLAAPIRVGLESTRAIHDRSRGLAQPAC